MLMVGGYFFSAIFILAQFPFLDLTAIQLLKLFCFFLGLSFLVPIRLYRKRIELSYYEYLFFNFICLAPVFIVLTFSINEVFKGETYIESYEIVQRKVSRDKIILTLEDQSYQNKAYMRTINTKDNSEIRGNNNYALYLSDGLLGIRIIEKKRLY